jgi:small subunit ribosomal protein S4
MKLFLKGPRCFTDKCAFERRPFPPGIHKGGRKRLSSYGLQLREKQKVRFIYGITERQFKKYFDMATKMPGLTGENLLSLLERRLDNVVFRMGLSDSRAEARQMVLHGHFLVNGKRVNIPSYLVEVGDVIELSERGKEHENSSRRRRTFRFLPGSLWTGVRRRLWSFASRSGRISTSRFRNSSSWSSTPSDLRCLSCRT